MAEKAIEKVGEQLNCSICLDTYTDPKILQCFHVYCQKCLVKLVVRDQQGQLSLSCPICRQVTPVPASGTAGLPSAFRENRLLEILDQHKKAKAESTSAEREGSKAESLSPQSHSALSCSEHGGREVELFCETCQELLCWKCVIKGGKHFDHECRDISESFERYREQVMPSLKPLEKQLTSSAKVLTQLDRHCEEITDQQAAIEAEIRASSKQLHELISKRQDFLIGRLEQVTRRKLKRLATQRDQIETRQAQLSSCLEFTRESLKTGIEQREVLVMKSGILKQVGELTPASQTGIFTLSTAADMVFLASADAAAVCENHGRVFSPDPILTLKYLGYPRGVAVTGRGEVVVVEYRADCVFVFNPRGEKLRSFGTRGSGEGQFRGPSGVAVDGEGNLLVTDRCNNRIQKFTAEGHFLKAVGSKGSGTLQFDRPCDIVYSASSNKVYVTDTYNNRVQVLNSDLSLSSEFGRGGSSKGQFEHPSGVTTDSTGKVYVADSDNFRIQVFTAEGGFLRMFGREGAGRGELNRPFGVTVDASGLVYISELYNHRVSVFTSEGKFVTSFGSVGNGPGQFEGPRGLAVDDSGVIYVCDSDNKRVQIF